MFRFSDIKMVNFNVSNALTGTYPVVKYNWFKHFILLILIIKIEKKGFFVLSTDNRESDLRR